MSKGKKISEVIKELEQLKERYGDVLCRDHTYDEVKFSPASKVIRKMKDGSVEESELYYIPEYEDVMKMIEIKGEVYESYEIITELYI